MFFVDFLVGYVGFVYCLVDRIIHFDLDDYYFRIGACRIRASEVLLLFDGFLDRSYDRFYYVSFREGFVVDRMVDYWRLEVFVVLVCRGLGIIFSDYLQLAGDDGRAESARREVLDVVE